MSAGDPLRDCGCDCLSLRDEKHCDTRRMFSAATSASTTFLGMSTRIRTPRGTGEDRVQIAFRVSGQAKTKVNRMADALGLSQSQVMELALSAIDIDDDGFVFVGDVPLVVPASQEELPLSRTA